MSVVQLLNEKGHEIMALRYTTVAALALLAYECLITIEAETALIWPSRLSLPKVLFLVNRYVSIATGIVTMYILVPDTDYGKCKTLFIVSGALACSCYVFAEATLFVRAYAVWGRKLSLLVFLSVVLAVSAVGVYYATVQFLLSTEPSPLRVFHSGCLLVTSNRIEWISLIILVCNETIALNLLLARAFLYYRNQTLASVLLRTMVTDGTMYYVCILLTTIANVLILRLEDTTLNCMLLVPQGILHSILCNRLLLRIRDVGNSSSLPITPLNSS